MVYDVPSLLGSILTIIAYFMVFSVSLLIFVQKRKYDFRSTLYLLVTGISFFLLGIAAVFIIIGLAADSAYILTAQTLAWSVLLTLFVIRISDVRRLSYLFFLVLISVALVFAFSPEEWLFLINFVSYYIATISFFALFVFSTQPIRNAGLYGSVSVVTATFLTALRIPFYSILWAVPALLLAVSFTFFLRFGLMFDHFIQPEKLSLATTGRLGIDVLKNITRLFAYILLLNIAVFAASVFLHELGHLAVGNLLGCSGGEIVLLDLFRPENLGPYTLISCPPQVGADFSLLLGLSGFAFLIPFGIIFILLKRFPERNMGYIVFGMGLLLAGLDFLLVIPSSLITYLSIIAGTALVCVGEVLLINDYISYKNYREKTENIAKTV